jgi:hypothetical protein
VPKLLQEVDRLRRDSSICKKPHASRTERVHLVLSEGSGVGERLADIVFFEVGQFVHNLRWRDAVGDEVDDVSHRNAKPTNRRSPGEHVWVVIVTAREDFWIYDDVPDDMPSTPEFDTMFIPCLALGFVPDTESEEVCEAWPTQPIGLEWLAISATMSRIWIARTSKPRVVIH